jgi:tetratricopeptide (TPR) repeat protein
LKWWHPIAGVVVFLLLALEIYGPALQGPFLFDDVYLPFFDPGFSNTSIRNAMGLRPLLMLSFLANYRISELAPYSYHLVNVLLHFMTSVLAWLIIRKLGKRAGHEGWRVELFSLFAGAVYLVHPLQTESVAYVASRSEVLSVMFAYASIAVFLYRPSGAISFPASVAVLALFAAGVLTKEHIAVLPAIFVLTDVFWAGERPLKALQRNWKLYVPMAIGGVAALAFVWRVIRGADTAGFGVADLPWHAYLFTQFRAIWLYIRMFFLPYGLNIDPDFALSRTIVQHGSILGLIGLLASGIAAVYFRKRYSLASYGAFAFLLLLAPTSSLVPIKDAVAEHRMYLPMIGLLCIVTELLARITPPAATPRSRLAVRPAPVIAALTGVLIALGITTWKRNQVWSSGTALWEDSVAKSPGKWRPHFQLAFAYYQDNRCSDAVRHYEIAHTLGRPDARLYVNWGLALDCSGRPGDAIAKLLQAAELEKTAHVYSTIGMIYAKQGRRAEALDAFDTAVKLNAAYDITYLYRGNLYAVAGEFDKAAQEYRRAVALNPQNALAQNGLRMAEERLNQAPRI